MNSAVASASNAMLARLVHLAEIVRIARLALMPTLVRRHVYYVKRAGGAVLSGLTMSPPAETVLSEGTRQPLEFRRSQDAMHVLLESFRIILVALLSHFVCPAELELSAVRMPLCVKTVLQGILKVAEVKRLVSPAFPESIKTPPNRSPVKTVRSAMCPTQMRRDVRRVCLERPTNLDLHLVWIVRRGDFL